MLFTSWFLGKRIVGKISLRLSNTVTLILTSRYTGCTHILNCCCSVTKSYTVLCNPVDYNMPGWPALHCLQEFAQTQVHWVGDASSSVISFSSCLQSFSATVFSNELALCIKWPKYWSFSFRISPSNEYSGLIYFKIDWFDLLVVQRTFKSLLQHHSSKAYILWCSAFFMVQISHPYMTTGKTIALTRWASLLAQLVKNLPAMRETWSWVGKIPWRRERLPTPVFWPGEFHGLYRPWGHKDLDMTEWFSLSLRTLKILIRMLVQLL